MSGDERKMERTLSLCSSLRWARVSGYIPGAKCVILIYWEILFFITQVHRSNRKILSFFDDILHSDSKWFL